MKKWLPAVALIALIAVVWLGARRAAPPEVSFARATRERLVSTLVTNGKTEPLEWARVRAARAGTVRRVAVERGGAVAANDVLAELDPGAAPADLAAAEARIAQALAEIETLDRGGREADRADIDGQLARVRLELQQEESEAAALSRLAEKNAATRREAEAAGESVLKLREQARGLEARKAALAPAADRKTAEARLREARAAAEVARKAIEWSLIRAPMGGVVYKLAVRAGAYLNPGDEVAEIGRIERLRIIVYVDEPELGRVGRGMPVTVTWDALAGREWKGEVEKLPAAVTTLGTREVGEVLCAIDNPGRDLPPGANVNASITSRVVEGALVIPREALRRENGQTGVYTVENNVAVWRAVETGASSVTRIQIVKGLNAGEFVALGTDIALRPGMKVEAEIR
jgi:HlyD family secretion protein